MIDNTRNYPPHFQSHEPKCQTPLQACSRPPFSREVTPGLVRLIDSHRPSRKWYLSFLTLEIIKVLAWRRGHGNKGILTTTRLQVMKGNMQMSKLCTSSIYTESVKFTSVYKCTSNQREHAYDYERVSCLVIILLCKSVHRSLAQYHLAHDPGTHTHPPSLYDLERKKGRKARNRREKIENKTWKYIGGLNYLGVTQQISLESRNTIHSARKSK